MAEGKGENPARGWQPNLYDTLGLVVPGGWLLFGLLLLELDVAALIASGKASFGLGELGLFALIAFAAGHLAAAAGNVLERAWWGAQSGMPTDWAVLPNPLPILSVEQRAVLEKRIPERLGVALSGSIVEAKPGSWAPLVRQIYTDVASAGRAVRVDVFNANYGMLRGIAGASLLLTAYGLYEDKLSVKAGLLLVACALVAALRMDGFARNYARELFAQFLQLEPAGARRTVPQGGAEGE